MTNREDKYTCQITYIWQCSWCGRVHETPKGAIGCYDTHAEATGAGSASERMKREIRRLTDRVSDLGYQLAAAEQSEKPEPATKGGAA